jgi:hypothetical protein
VVSPDEGLFDELEPEEEKLVAREGCVVERRRGVESDEDRAWEHEERDSLLDDLRRLLGGGAGLEVLGDAELRRGTQAGPRDELLAIGD